MSAQVSPDIRITAKPVIAGIIDIVAGSLGLFGVLIACFGVLMFLPVGEGLFGGVPVNTMILGLLIAVPAVALGIVSIIGGIHNLKRENWSWALAGSITTAVMTLIGIASIILTAVSRDEFEK